MKLLGRNELNDVRDTMLATTRTKEPFRLAFMTEKYAEMITLMISGYDGKMDVQIDDLVGKLNDIAGATRRGELDVDDSYFLSCSYVDTFVVKVLGPWIHVMYGDNFVPHSVFRNVMIGDA